MSLSHSAPGARLVLRRPLDRLLTYLPIPILAGGIGSILILSSKYGSKWFVAVFLAAMSFFTLLLFKQFYIFGMWLLAACIPLAIQYKLLTHGDKGGMATDHFGGAAGEPTVWLVDFPAIFLFICWVAYLALNREAKLPRWTRFDTLVSVFLLLSCFSALNSTEFALFTFELVRYLKYFALYWVLRTFLDRNNDICFVGLFVILIANLPLQAFVSMLQYFLFFTLPIPVGGVSMSTFELVNGELIQRVTGLVGHSNTFAHYLLIPLTFCLTFFFMRVPFRWKVLLMPFFMSGLIPLVLTFSRSGWLFFCVASMLVGTLALLTRRLNIAYVVGLGLCGILVLAGVVVSNVWEVIMVRIFEDSGNAYDSRWDLFCLAARVIRDYPIVGVGLNSFEENMGPYDENGIRNIIDQPVHNVFALIAAETGLVCMALFVLIGLVLLAYSWKLVRQPTERSFFVGCVGITTLLTLACANMLDLSLRKEALVGAMTLLAAVIVSDYARVSEPNRVSPSPLDEAAA